LYIFLSRFRINKVRAPTLVALLVIGIVVNAIPVVIESAGSAPHFLMVGDNVIVSPVHTNVTVYRDDWGVPHIYAYNSHDAYYALGYAMAEDRLFEMDLFRRAVAGRLGEIFGDLMFKDDVIMRTLGIYQIAVDTWDGLYSDIAIPPEVKENLEMFSAGVNRYISDNLGLPWDVPCEYIAIHLLSGTPISDLIPYDWTPPDSVAIAGMMGLMLTDTSAGEIIRGGLASMVDPMYAAVGLPGMTEFLMPTGWVNTTTIMPPSGGGGGGGLGDLGSIEAITAPLQRLLGFSGLSGSNNWVIDDLNTTTGYAMLANDPHLDLQAPGIWWQVHMNITDYANVIGCCIVGGPVVGAGHNDYFAWGPTNFMADIVDMYYYVSNETHYYYVDHWEPFDVRYETIYNLSQPIQIPVVSTRHGPLVTTPMPPPFDKMAFRWGGKESGYGEIVGLSRIMNATNLAEWREALSHTSVVIQNWVYADKDGNIAWCPSGKIPLRSPPPPLGTGTLGAVPSNGSAGQNEWMGWLPHSTNPVDLGTGHGPVSLPYTENPSQGYIATANNQPIDPTYNGYPWPIWISPACAYDPGYRGQRIVELIESLEPIDIDDMKAIQADSLCIPARNMVPIVLGVMTGETNATMINALNLLAAWNFTELRNMTEPLIWEAFLEKFTDNTFGDELWAGMGLYPFPNTIISLWNMTQTWNWNPYAQVLFDDQNTIGIVETMPQIVNKSLHDALDWIASQLGPPADASFSNWKYGDLHVVSFGHPVGIAPETSFFNIPPTGPVGCDGGPYTVDPGGHHHELFVHDVLYVESGASYRGIFECKDGWDTSLILVPPGESGSVGGNPFVPIIDPHYDDTFLLWLNNQYTTCLYNDTEIQTYPKTIFVREMHTNVFEITQFGQTFCIVTESTSVDVANLAFDWELKRIEFEVTGFDGTTGVCNVTIPKELLDADPGDWIVVVDSTPVTPVVTENATHSSLYFSYFHSTHTVKITGTWTIEPPPGTVGGKAIPIDLPKFPALLMWISTIIFLMVATALYVKLKKKKQ